MMQLKWHRASIRTKILIPFVLIYGFIIVLGTYYFIHMVSEMKKSNLSRHLNGLSSMLSNELYQLEQRLLFHAQSMAEMKILEDQMPEGHQVTMFQTLGQQALSREKIRFLGVYGKDMFSGNPYYPIVQEGLGGIRATSLVKTMGEGGTSLQLAAVAPIEGTQGVDKAVLLDINIYKDFLLEFRNQIGSEIVLFDLKGSFVISSHDDPTGVQEVLTRNLIASSLTGDIGPHGGLFQSVEIAAIPYLSMITPLIVNGQKMGALALMSPTQTFMQVQRSLLVQAFIFGFVVLLIMTFLYVMIIRQITTPLKALETASRSMMKGKPVESISSVSMDEVGILTRSFNQMSQSLLSREKELSHKAVESRNKSAELNAILEHMTEGVVVQNENCEIEYMNEASVRMFGSHLGEKCYQVFFDRHEPCQPCSIDMVLGRHQSFYQYSTEDHEGRHFEIIAQPLHDVDGKVKVMTLRRDVTDRIRHHEEEKRLQERVQEERINTIHQVGVSVKHGINNALMAIFGLLELFKNRDSQLTDQEKEVIRMIESEAKKIRNVVSKLSKLTDPVVTQYVEDITMIDLRDSDEDV